MSSLAAPDLTPQRTAHLRRQKLNLSDRRGDRVLRYLAIAAGGLLLVVLVLVLIQLLSGASQAFNRFGFAFIGHTTWIPALDKFGALPFIAGTVISSLVGTVFAAVVGIAAGLFLALLAPRRIAAIIGPLVEMLAAVPSVVIGLLGIAIISPFMHSTIEPALHSALGWTPFFGEYLGVGNSMFTAILVLTVMVVPIIAALTRDAFLTVPQDLRDGAEALGATRWEMIRGVVLPTTTSAMVAACVLGFARAAEEAIAVTQVVGGNTIGVHANLLTGGSTIGSVVAGQYGTPQDNLHTSSMLYLLVILLLIEVATNLLARRFVRKGVAR